GGLAELRLQALEIGPRPAGQHVELARLHREQRQAEPVLAVDRVALDVPARLQGGQVPEGRALRELGHLRSTDERRAVRFLLQQIEKIAHALNGADRICAVYLGVVFSRSWHQERVSVVEPTIS